MAPGACVAVLATTGEGDHGTGRVCLGDGLGGRVITIDSYGEVIKPDRRQHRAVSGWTAWLGLLALTATRFGSVPGMLFALRLWRTPAPTHYAASEQAVPLGSQLRPIGFA